MSKLCKSCSGPVNKESKSKDFCSYCIDKKGEVKGYKDILDGMIYYIKNEHKEIRKEKRLDQAQKWLKEGKYWGKKFVNNDIVIELVRDQNVKDIPIMNKAKHFDCNRCMYYMREKGFVGDKKKWFELMEKKYKLSCGMILYYMGESVGYVQYAPKI